MTSGAVGGGRGVRKRGERGRVWEEREREDVGLVMSCFPLVRGARGAAALRGEKLIAWREKGRTPQRTRTPPCPYRVTQGSLAERGLLIKSQSPWRSLVITNTCRWQCHVILTSRGFPDQVSEEPDCKAAKPLIWAMTKTSCRCWSRRWGRWPNRLWLVLRSRPKATGFV